MTVTAGDVARAQGKATWHPKDGATDISLELDTTGLGLPQTPLGDALRQPISLDAHASIRGSLVTLGKAELKAGPHRLALAGRYDLWADHLEGNATLHSAEAGSSGSLLDGTTWRELHVEAEIDVGTLATGPDGTIKLTGSADGVSLAALDNRVPSPGSSEISADIRIDGRDVIIDSLSLTSSLVSVMGSGSYSADSGNGEVKATVVLPSLAPLSDLAGRPLTGRATFDAKIERNDQGYVAELQGTASDVTAGGLPADVVSSPIRLSAKASWQHDNTWNLQDLRLTADGGTFTLRGQGHGGTGALNLSLDLPRLQDLEPDLSGAASVTSHISLGDQTTAITLTATLSNLEYGQLDSRGLTITTSGSLAASGVVTGEITANGALAGHPLALDGRLAVDMSAGGITVPSFEGRWASVVLDVDNFVVRRGLTSGHATLRIGDLSDASIFYSEPLDGSLEVEVTAEQAPNDHVKASVHGSDLRAGTLAIESLDMRASIEDPLTTGTLDAMLEAKGIAGVGGIGRLSVTAKGNRQSTAVSLKASGPQTRAELAANLKLAADDIIVALSELKGRYASIPFSLNVPTRLRIADSVLTVDGASLRVGGGRVAASGTLAPSGGDLRLKITRLPLSIIEAFAPEADLEGTLTAKLHAQGSMEDPQLEGSYTVSGLRLQRSEAALIPPLAIRGSVKSTGRQVCIDARVSSKQAINVTVKGNAVLPGRSAPWRGSVSIAGTIDVGPFAPLLGNEVRNVAGRLRPNVTLEFAGTEIEGAGTIDFSNGALTMPEWGLQLSRGAGRLSLHGNALTINRLVFQAGRGTVAVTGSLAFDATQGVVPDLAVTSRNALLVNRPDLVGSVSSNVSVTGSTASGMHVSGPITIERAEIAVGPRLLAEYPTLDVREINKPGAPKAAPRAPPSPDVAPVRLDLAIGAPQGVFVRGRGLDAEMTGQLNVGGTLETPAVTGRLTMRRGEFNLLGRRLTFERGVVTLDNLDRIEPRLDFVASTTVQSTAVTVRIGGTSRKPTVVVESSPELPPDEAMALLLFGKPASQLSVFELAQAAQGLAELTGSPSGSGLLGRVRTGLGLDRLSLESGSGTDSPVSLEAGRYIAPRVYVGARQGTSGSSGRGVVEIEVLENVKIEAEVGADASNRVGVKMEWDY
jgi:translocation and assembly module TamB